MAFEGIGGKIQICTASIISVENLETKISFSIKVFAAKTYKVSLKLLT